MTSDISVKVSVTWWATTTAVCVLARVSSITLFTEQTFWSGRAYTEIIE
jgi:hypothetical protein